MTQDEFPAEWLTGVIKAACAADGEPNCGYPTCCELGPEHGVCPTPTVAIAVLRASKHAELVAERDEAVRQWKNYEAVAVERHAQRAELVAALEWARRIFDNYGVLQDQVGEALVAIDRALATSRPQTQQETR